MEKFNFKGTEYDIIESYGTSGTETWQNGEAKKTSNTIIKTIFPVFPIIKNRKFRWLKKCKVQYRLYFSRQKEFDDGWSYQEYWTPWKNNFILEKILD